MTKLPFAINGAKFHGSLGGGLQILNVSSFTYILVQVRNPSIFNAILVGQQCYNMIVDLSKFLYPGHATTKIDNAKLPLPDMPDYVKHQSTDDYYHIKKTTGGYLWFALGDNDEY